MSCVRTVSVVCVMLLLGSAARVASAASTEPAVVDSGRAQLDAAARDAREAIRDDVFNATLTPGLSVRQFVDRTAGSAEDLLKVIQDARQRGGTRWVDDQTCQLLLEVRGTDLADVLSSIAKAHADKLPVPADELRRGIEALKGQSFSALGKSTRSANLDRVRPRDGAESGWRSVAEADRRDALNSARLNAVARVVESLRPIPTGPDASLDSAFAHEGVIAEVRQWIVGRPVTSVEFGDNLEVRLTLSAPPEQFWPALQSALIRNQLGPAPDDSKGWDEIRGRVYRDMAPAVGHGVANLPHDPAVKGGVVVFPRSAPQWVGRVVEVDSSATGGGLKTARVAEATALEQIRAKLDQLPLNETSTLGQAAKIDPSIDRKITATLRRASTTKVDYQRGMVRVRVTIDTEEVWRALRGDD